MTGKLKLVVSLVVAIGASHLCLTWGVQLHVGATGLTSLLGGCVLALGILCAFVSSFLAVGIVYSLFEKVL